jgi:hypothetical protein
MKQLKIACNKNPECKGLNSTGVIIFPGDEPIKILGCWWLFDNPEGQRPVVGFSGC